jgi:MFS family permease
MDSMLYNIVMIPALQTLLGDNATKTILGHYGGIIMSYTLFGAALGGILFGILADYIGRVKTLLLTILMYSLMTGLSGIAHSWQELAFYRFLTGFGIGGEWAVGAVLLAESWPDNKRTFAGSFMQMGWPVGFFLAALINYLVGEHGWRYVFYVGALPALLTVFLRFKLKEPEKWLNDHKRRIELKKTKNYVTEEEKEYAHFIYTSFQ